MLPLYMLAVLVGAALLTPQQAAEGKDKSTWVVLARQPARLAPLLADPRWESLPRLSGRPDRAKSLWTDDYSNVAGALRLWRRILE